MPFFYRAKATLLRSYHYLLTTIKAVFQDLFVQPSDSSPTFSRKKFILARPAIKRRHLPSWGEYMTWVVVEDPETKSYRRVSLPPEEWRRIKVSNLFSGLPEKAGESDREGFFRRWFYSPNQKEIGTLFLLFGTFAAILGTFIFLRVVQPPSSTPAPLSFVLNLQHPLNWSLAGDNYYTEYGKIIITFLIATLLCFLLFILSYFFSFANQKEYEKTSEYECGFEPFDSATRQPYDVHFYMVGILFLVFDVEIALLFPWAANLSAVSSTGFWSTLVFLVILTIGFVYEWQRGALSWPHPTIDLNKG